MTMLVIPHLPRRERERLMRRKEIIDAAREVFARKGFKDATLEDVAERAEFGKGTLYNYFSNKEGLFICVLEDSFETIKKIAEDAFNAEIPFNEKVERFVRGELTFFFNNIESVQLMMREAHHIREGNPLMQLMPQLLAIVAERIGAEQRKRKVIGNADPTDLAAILVNMLYGQFAARFYRRSGACLAERHDDQPADLSPVFQPFSKEEAEREINAATKLILTVYFQGISR